MINLHGKEMKGIAHRENIRLAVKHYSSLFFIPPLKVLISALLLVSLLFGFIISLLTPKSIILPASENIFVGGVLLGSLFFVVSVLPDYLVNRLLFMRDIIFSSFKRTIFLSLASSIIFIVLAVLGLSLGHLNAYINALSIGLYLALSFRFLVVDTISFARRSSRFMLSVFQPILLSLSLILLAALPNQETLRPFAVMYPLLLALAFSMLSVWLFKASLDAEGVRLLGLPSLEVAKAFVANWAEDIREPFERVLERLSEERTVRVSAIVFREKGSERFKAIMVVPNIHPGPFKNIGSSLFPSMVKEALEREFGCIVSVPHGISGHELDLPSQAENEKVIRALISSLKEPRKSSSKATKFLMVEETGAKVGCQVFDDCALITLSTSPDPMEDLPLELNDTIVRKALESGFSWAIVIDAHNSINGQFDMERAVTSLKRATFTALEKASFLRHTAISEIKVGAGKSQPGDLGLKDGMGPGGITVIVLEVGGERTAYISIDGNNMVSGLREKILSALMEIGISGGEVFTSDTHAVSAIVLNKRGYHPIGEAIDHERIIKEVKKAAQEAIENLSSAEFSWHNISIPGVKVIGERRISELSLLTDNTFKKAKRASSIFAIFGVLLIALTYIF